MTTDREKAAFEAGIKLGALYHQWVGTPVSPDTAPLLEQAMERSVALQPHVRHVRIHLNRERILPNPFGYSEVKGEQFEVQLTTRVGDATCHAVLSYEGGYPLMKIASFEGGTP